MPQLFEILIRHAALRGQPGRQFDLGIAGGRLTAIRERIESYVASHANARAYASLGPLRYWSAMKQVDAVVGNSSSGILEAPSLQKPTVNIGDRQKGRPQAASVINCGYGVSEIESAIRRAFDLNCREVANPYGDGHAAERIVEVLRNLGDPRQLVHKRFVDWDAP